MASDCDNPEYLDASFKGVPFVVENSNDEYGRRVAIYEYPLSEQTATKDLGRKIRRFRIEGYLIGGDHVAQTQALITASESPEAGLLVHPALGPVQVNCITFNPSIDYKTGKRRTKLSFEFVEANLSLAPYLSSISPNAILLSGDRAVQASRASATWVPTRGASEAALAVSEVMAVQLSPARTEAALDAQDALRRGRSSLSAFATFAGAVDPVIDGSAQIRITHLDAQTRLRTVNRALVEAVEAAPSIESFGVTGRLAIVRDFALVTAQRTYTTVRDALNDLDFVMAVYDEEEAIATGKCDNALLDAIRNARAVAASAILAQNITLPGVTVFDAKGVWPSLVSAQVIYGDGNRYQEIENYNPTFSPFFMDRELVGLSK